MNVDRIERKLRAILAKDVLNLVTKKVQVPFLGDTYAVETLQAFLSDRIDILNKFKTLTDAEIAVIKDKAYKDLCKTCKPIGDAILNNSDSADDILPCGSSDYLRLCVLRLYMLGVENV